MAQEFPNTAALKSIIICLGSYLQALFGNVTSCGGKWQILTAVPRQMCIFFVYFFNFCYSDAFRDFIFTTEADILIMSHTGDLPCPRVTLRGTRLHRFISRQTRLDRSAVLPSSCMMSAFHGKSQQQLQAASVARSRSHQASSSRQNLVFSLNQTKQFFLPSCIQVNCHLNIELAC